MAILMFSMDPSMYSNSYLMSASFYAVLNDELRKLQLVESQEYTAERYAEKQAIILCWQGFMWWFLWGLRDCPKFAGVVYRAVMVPDAKELTSSYAAGRKVVWSSFSSTSKSLRQAWLVAARAALQAGVSMDRVNERVVTFKIQVFCGRNIQKYSYFEEEEEVLMTPQSEYIVAFPSVEKQRISTVKDEFMHKDIAMMDINFVPITKRCLRDVDCICLTEVDRAQGTYTF